MPGGLPQASRSLWMPLRLMNPNEDYDETYAPHPPKPPVQHLEYCQVLQVGPPQGPAFAHALRVALSKMPSPGGILAEGSAPTPPDGFGSDVGFRVWKVKARTNIYLGFYSNGGQIVSRDAHNKLRMQTESVLDASRPAFLALSRQAFPQDAALAGLK